MSDFSRVAFAWGTAQGGTPAGPPSVSVSLWPHVLGIPMLRWGSPEDQPDLTPYDVFMVNLFPTSDGTHIEQIRRACPDATIIAMPDPSLDLVLMNMEWFPMIQQMALADIIGGRTQHDCQVYGALLNKPTFCLPSPIGPTEYYEPFRDLTKDDYILTLDHPMQPDMVAHNVAALAALQRENGCRVIYAAARVRTQHYAWLAGLKAEFLGHVPFMDFIEMTARARLCVDLYARHSYHRQAALCAMVGTPCVGSTWCSDFGQVQVDPFDTQTAVRAALNLLAHTELYETVRRRGFAAIEAGYSFEASRRRVQTLLDQIPALKAEAL
jgi:hypothetical protein